MEKQTSKTKLPVFHVVKDAVLVPIKEWRTLFVALAATGMGMILLQIAASIDLFGEGFVASLLYMAFHAAIFILFAITCHRNILLGKEGTPKYGVIEWEWREWRYVGWAMVAYFYLYALMALAGMTVSLMTPIIPECESPVYYGTLYMLAALPGLYVFSRLCLVFPAVAIDKKTSWNWVWDITEGNGWRLVLVIGFLPMLLSIIPGLLTGIHILIDSVLVVFGIFLLVVEITALSLSFKYLAGE